MSQPYDLTNVTTGLVGFCRRCAKRKALRWYDGIYGPVLMCIECIANETNIQTKLKELTDHADK